MIQISIDLFNEIKKMITDTLQNNDKKYSSKKFITAQSFVLIALAFIFDTLINKKVNIELFLIFAVLSGYSSTVSVMAEGAKAKFEAEQEIKEKSNIKNV